MTKETMTVHQALCELKLLSKRISAAIRATKPIGVKENGSQKVDAMPISEFKALAQSTHDSACDLIKRQMAIKAAVNQYNATKVITVAGQEYSIAQALWLMSYGMAEQKEMLSRYSSLLTDASARIERENGERLNQRAEAAMNAIMGGKDKADSADYLKGIEDYKKSHALEIVDPIGIRPIIESMEKEISSFEAGVDAAIQVANATTEIAIEY